MIDLLSGLAGSIVLFALATLVIAFVGTRLSGVADQLADRSGFGEAIMGGVLLGAVTSLSGSVLSISAAFNNQPELALGNAFGGMGAQMAFLAVADIAYRRANLEHAAASAENIMQGALLVGVLSVVLIATYSPAWAIFGIHPGTILLVATYIYGMRLVQRSKKRPMWEPRETRDTVTDVPDAENSTVSLKALWGKFALLGGILGLTGWVMQWTATNLIAITGMEAAVMGALFTSVATSLPELVTSIAAVKRKALTLAVSGIIGGNAYDALFAAFSDMAYRQGSIYHTLTPNLLFWIAINLAMAGVLIMGLLLRERRGIGNIGFESFTILGLYAMGVAILLIG